MDRALINKKEEAEVKLGLGEIEKRILAKGFPGCAACRAGDSQVPRKEYMRNYHRLC